MEGRIRINAPVPGTCPVCAGKHRKTEPHDLNSLYYVNRFWRDHKRFPTAEDAIAHLDEKGQKRWRAKLGLPQSAETEASFETSSETGESARADQTP